MSNEFRAQKIRAALAGLWTAAVLFQALCFKLSKALLMPCLFHRATLLHRGFGV